MTNFMVLISSSLYFAFYRRKTEFTENYVFFLLFKHKKNKIFKVAYKSDGFHLIRISVFQITANKPHFFCLL